MDSTVASPPTMFLIYKCYNIVNPLIVLESTILGNCCTQHVPPPPHRVVPEDSFGGAAFCTTFISARESKDTPPPRRCRYIVCRTWTMSSQGLRPRRCCAFVITH